MRLTLRTLLAYLDRTLDPADESGLKEKVHSSTIATSLVERIQQVLGNRSVGAPSPDAASPNDDANTIAEYLDSTLAPELTADVERRCIESDVQLAEVAAAHQVLTAALSEPVTIPPSLRRRVYDLRPMANNGASGDMASETASGDTVISSGTSGMITPAGPGDSGVSDATTRMSADPGLSDEHERDLSETLAAAGKAIRKNKRQEVKVAATGGIGNQETVISPSSEPNEKSHLDQRRDVAMAMAGYRPRRTIEQIDPLLSGGRPSRVVPYLVSLALVAAFLVVLTQALGPLIRGKRELANVLPGDEKLAENSRPNTLIPPKRDPTVVVDGAENTKPKEASTGETIAAAPPVSPAEVGPGVASDDPPIPFSENEAKPATSPQTEVQPSPPVSTSPEPNSQAANPTPADSTSGKDNGSTGVTPAPGSGAPGLGTPASMLDSAESDANRMFQPLILGGLLDDGGLLLSQDNETGRWNRVRRESKLTNGQVLVCPPTFRSRVVLDGGIELTLVGPTGVRLDRIDEVGGNASGQANRLFLTIDFGRVSAMTTRGTGEISLATPAGSGRIVMGTGGSVAAIEVGFRRQPGADPLELTNYRPILAIDSVQGQIGWRGSVSADEASSNNPYGVRSSPNNSGTVIPTGQRMMHIAGRGTQLADSPLLSTGSWVDTPVEPADSLVAVARRGLAEALANDSRSVELALREMVVSRHEAVGALAAETLLNLGMPDVYFGPAGVLNDPQQKPNWPELTDALRGFYDRGTPSAAITGAALGGLEGESAGNIWRLLIGFSNEELKRGGSDVIVTLLDDPKLSVRVMAIETLRLLTGTTLGYQADNPTPALRRESIRKWRQRIEREPLAWPGS